MKQPESYDAIDESDLEQGDEEPLAEGSLPGLASTGAVLALSLLFFARSFSINLDAEIWPNAGSCSPPCQLALLMRGPGDGLATRAF